MANAEVDKATGVVRFKLIESRIGNINTQQARLTVHLEAVSSYDMLRQAEELLRKGGYDFRRSDTFDDEIQQLLVKEVEKLRVERTELVRQLVHLELQVTALKAGILPEDPPK